MEKIKKKTKSVSEIKIRSLNVNGIGEKNKQDKTKKKTEQGNR